MQYDVDEIKLETVEAGYLRAPETSKAISLDFMI